MLNQVLMESHSLPSWLCLEGLLPPKAAALLTSTAQGCPVPTPATLARSITPKQASFRCSLLIPEARDFCLPGQRPRLAGKWGYMPKTGYSTTQDPGSDPVQGQDAFSKLSFVPYWSCCICQRTADVSTGTLPTILLFPMTAFHSISFYNIHVYQPQRQIYRWWQEFFKRCLSFQVLT